MAPKLVLTYFNGIGRALPTRLALAIGHIDYELRTQTYQELKADPENPLGQLPTFSVDGELLTQSMAMLSYAMRLAKIEPEDPLDVLRSMEVAELANEMMAKAPYSMDQEEKKRLREEYAAGTLKKLMTLVDKRIGSYNKKYAVLDQPSAADFVLAMIVATLKSGFYDYIPTTYTDAFPNITRAYNALLEIPEVAKTLSE